MKYKVPFIKPSFPTAEEMSIEYTKIVERNWFTNYGPLENKFRESIQSYLAIGSEHKYAVTFNNATSALIASIITLLGKGDNKKYIIIPSFTFVAGAEAILWCGYEPLFIDIDRETLQPSLESAKDLLNNKHKEIAAMLLCNTFGIGNPFIDRWEELAGEYEKVLIIDSAAGFGSLYTDGSRVGTKGDCEILSFHATKPFAIGEGGAVITGSEEVAAKLKEFTNFGFDHSRNAVNLGINAKLQELNAAIGLLQFNNFSERLISRRKTLKKFEEVLNGINVRGIINADKSSVCFGSFVCESESQRDDMMNIFDKRGVETRKYYYPAVHKQTLFSGADKQTSLHNTELVSGLVLSIPVHDYMREEDILLITEIINSYEA